MRISIPALIFSYLLAPDASACICEEVTLQNSANYAHLVFFATLQEAKVVSGNSQNDPSIEGRFLVDKTLKGSLSAHRVVLHTPLHSSSCGVKMMVGERYVIFKRRDSDAIVSCDGSGVLGHFGPVSKWDEDEVAAGVQKAAQEKTRQR